ncbi:MAG: PEP-CTERM sorting domain-containing protein [Pseudomonadota bacterium]
MRHLDLIRLTFVASLLLTPLLAQASPYLMLRLASNSQSNYEYHQVDTNDCLHFSPLDGSPCANPWDGSALSASAQTGAGLGSSTAGGTFGALSAGAHVNLWSPAWSGSGASGSGIANFFDSFTLNSSSLAVGTAVDVRYSVDLDWGTNATYAGVPQYYQTTNFGARIYNGGQDCCYIAGIDYTNNSTVGSLGSVPSAIRTYQVGQTVDFSGLLHWSLGANWQSDSLAGPQNLFLDLDALYHIEVLTPGVTFTTASGALYGNSVPPSVPEPGTLSLFASALLLGVLRGRRRLGGIR